MREIFTSGSVGGASGNRCFYLETDAKSRAADLDVRHSIQIAFIKVRVLILHIFYPMA